MSSSAPWDSKAERKLLKPLMEKRRRERMNRSLERLRILLLEATQDERLKNPKVEKAEILQKTVHFVRTQPPAGTTEPARHEETSLRRYHSGYRECLGQATRFLRASPGICAGKEAYLMARICHCMERIAAWEPVASPPAARDPRHATAPGGPPLGGPAGAPPPAPAFPAAHGLPPLAPAKAPRDKRDGSRDSAGQPPAPHVWRPWP